MSASESCLFIELFVKQHERHTHRHHHHRGCCIGEPHRQKRRGDHKTKNESVGLTTDNSENAEGNPLVQIPFFDGGGDDKSTEIQEDDPVHVLCGDVRVHDIEVTQRYPRWQTSPLGVDKPSCRLCAPAHDAEQREQHDRKKRRRGKWNRLGNPPDCHPGDDCSHSRNHGVTWIELDEEQHKQKSSRPEEEANARPQRRFYAFVLTQLCLHCHSRTSVILIRPCHATVCSAPSPPMRSSLSALCIGGEMAVG